MFTLLTVFALGQCVGGNCLAPSTYAMPSYSLAPPVVSYAAPPVYALPTSASYQTPYGAPTSPYGAPSGAGCYSSQPYSAAPAPQTYAAPSGSGCYSSAPSYGRDPYATQSPTMAYSSPVYSTPVYTTTVVGSAPAVTYASAPVYAGAPVVVRGERNGLLARLCRAARGR